MTMTYTYQPDYATPPGDTLRELLEDKGLSQSDLAQRTGMAEKTISQIMSGEASISLDTANKFEFVLGARPVFGIAESLHIARHCPGQKRRNDSLPMYHRNKRRFLARNSPNAGSSKPAADKSEMVRRVLRFFCVSSVDAWRETFAKPAAQFRGGAVAKKHPGKVAAWLRMGEVKSEKMRDCRPFDKKAFQGTSRRFVDCQHKGRKFGFRR